MSEFPSFLRLNNSPLNGYTSFCLSSSCIEGHWVASSFLTFMNNVAINMGIQIYVHSCLSSLVLLHNIAQVILLNPQVWPNHPLLSSKIFSSSWFLEHKATENTCRYFCNNILSSLLLQTSPPEDLNSCFCPEGRILWSLSFTRSGDSLPHQLSSPSPCLIWHCIIKRIYNNYYVSIAGE